MSKSPCHDRRGQLYLNFIRKDNYVSVRVQHTNVYMRFRSFKYSGICSIGVEDLSSALASQYALERINAIALKQ